MIRLFGNWGRRAGAVAVLLWLCLEWPGWAASGDGFVRVREEADAAGVGIDARSEAVEKAQRSVVAQLLEKAFGNENLPLLARIIEAPENYIRSVQLLKVEIRDTRTWVEIETYVDRDSLLRQTAKLLLPQLSTAPAALILIATQTSPANPPQITGPGTVERAIEKILTQNHIQIVDGQLVRALYQDRPEELLRQVVDDEVAAADLVRCEFAPITIVGLAAVAAESRGASVVASTAKVTVRVYRADGKLVDALAREAEVQSADAGAGARAAIEDACEKMAQDLVAAAAMAATSVQQPNDVLLEVRQPGSRARFDQLLDRLRVFAGPDAVRELFYMDTLARVRVAYDDSLATLVDMITNRSYDGRVLETQSAVGRTIHARFIAP